METSPTPYLSGGRAKLVEPLHRARGLLEAAQPTPLELHARPDPVGDPLGQARGRGLDAREPQRGAEAHAHLHGADERAAPRALRTRQRDRHDRHAGLEREPSDAALGPAELVGAADAGALGEDDYDIAATCDRLGRLHRLLVGLAAADGERAEGVEEPALPAPLEQLALGYEVD